MKNPNKIFYQCLSPFLKEFLKSKGLKYLLECKHKESLCPMWIYLYDSEGLLDKYLEEWKTVRKFYNNSDDYDKEKFIY